MVIASLFTFDSRIMRISSTFTFALNIISSFTFICLKSTQIARIVKDHIKQMEAKRQNTSVSEQVTLIRSGNIKKSVNKSISPSLFYVSKSWILDFILMVIYIMHFILNEPIADGYRIAFLWRSTISYLNGALNHVIYAYRCEATGRGSCKIVTEVFIRNSIASSATEREALLHTVTLTENGEVKWWNRA